MVQRVRKSAGRRCVVKGCGRQVRPGTAACAKHGRSAEGKEIQRALHRLTSDLTEVVRDGEGENEAATTGRFRQRVARGDYEELLDEPLQEVLWQAGMEKSLQSEVGALRVVIRRMLLEEEDPGKMALGVSRATMALLRLLREKGEVERGWRSEATRAREREEQAARIEEVRAERAAREQRGAEEAARRAASVDQEKPKTNAQVAKEWREQGGHLQPVRTEPGSAKQEDEIIDAFSEMRSGYWDQWRRSPWSRAAERAAHGEDSPD